MAGYAIISLGGKQYRVQEGQRLLVDRVSTEEGKTFSPAVLLVADDDATELEPRASVTARVLAHVRGEKVTIGKYRPKSGYRRKTGFRAALTHVEIERIGGRGGAKADAKESASAEATAQGDVQRDERPQGMPKGYEEMTVAQIAEAAPSWRRPMLEAALEYERAHAARKGAIGALSSALAAKEES